MNINEKLKEIISNKTFNLVSWENSDFFEMKTSTLSEKHAVAYDFMKCIFKEVTPQFTSHNPDGKKKRFICIALELYIRVATESTHNPVFRYSGPSEYGLTLAIGVSRNNIYYTFIHKSTKKIEFSLHNKEIKKENEKDLRIPVKFMEKFDTLESFELNLKKVRNKSISN